jgi:hypothetical protein
MIESIMCGSWDGSEWRVEEELTMMKGEISAVEIESDTG